MNQLEIIKELLKKYHFYYPVPGNIRKKIPGAKKRVLKKILQQKGKSNIFNNIGISLFCFLEKSGFVYPLTRVIAFVKTTAIASTAIIVVSAVFMILNSITPAEKQLPAFSKAVYITNINGNAVIHNPGSKSENAYIKDTLVENGIISTGERSSVTLQITGTGVIRLMENSEVQINSMGQNRLVKLTLKKGSLYSIIKKQRNKIYRIWTPSAVITVKGTEFLTTYNDNVSSVELLRGTISLCRREGEDKEILLQEKHIIHIYKNRKVKIVPMKKLRQMELEKLSLDPYINEINAKSPAEIKNIFILAEEKKEEIDKKINQLKMTIQKNREKWRKLLPLDKLRKLGRKLYMFHMNDGTKIAGTVLKQNEKNIKIDTGTGEIDLPKKDIIRRIPID